MIEKEKPICPLMSNSNEYVFCKEERCMFWRTFHTGCGNVEQCILVRLIFILEAQSQAIQDQVYG